MLAALLTAGLLSAGTRPAGASVPVNLITTASSNTTVGSQIFANVNLMNTTEAPTGTVTFRVYGPINDACGSPAFTSTVSVTGVSINSAAFQTSVAGIYRWTTTYSGDDYYAPAGPTPCYTDSAKVIAGKVRNTLRLDAMDPNNDRLVAKADLRGYYPNGPITFILTGPNDPFCQNPPAFTARVGVYGSGIYSSPAFVPTVSGTYQWRTSYTGDNDNLGTATGCMNEDAAVSFTA